VSKTPNRHAAVRTSKSSSKNPIVTTRARSWHHFFPEWLAALRFTSGKKDPTRGPHNVRRPCFGVARWTGFLQAGIGGAECVLDPIDSFFATIVSIDCEDVEAHDAVCIL